MKDGEAESERAALALFSIKDEVRRNRLALHFVMLSGLRYNRQDIFDLLGRVEAMFPLESLRESSFYQIILDEGREEGRDEGREEGFEKGERETLIKLLRQMAAKRFPGFEIEDEIEQVKDLALLERLCLDLDQVPDADALRVRLAALIPKQ